MFNKVKKNITFIPNEILEKSKIDGKINKKTTFSKPNCLLRDSANNNVKVCIF